MNTSPPVSSPPPLYRDIRSLPPPSSAALPMPSSYPGGEDGRPAGTLTVNSDTPLPPYLTLHHLFTLTWLATPVISLLFVAMRLALSSSAAQDAVDDAKNDLLSSCQAAEKAATVAASLPRYMAEGTNRSIENAINATLDAAKDILILCLQALEGVVNFVVDTYRSTFLCFLELILRAGLAMLISAVQEITNSITTSLNAIRSNIQSDIASANSAIASAIGGINSLISFTGQSISVPQFTIPSLDALANVTIPTDFENTLIALNDSLPTLSQLRDTVNSLIDTPITDLINDINSTISSIRFNASVLVVPPQTNITFCNEMDLSVIDDLGHDLVKVVEIGIAVIAVVALFIVGVNVFFQWYRWRSFLKHVQRIKDTWESDRQSSGMTRDQLIKGDELLRLMKIAEHPLILRFSTMVPLKWILRTPRARDNFQWFAAYITYPPALACLLIGLGGLLSVLIQLRAIGPIQKHYSKQVAGTVASFSDTIANHINAAVSNSSTLYATQTNAVILTMQNDIDKNMFGWVNTTTTALNQTVNDLYQDVVNVVNSAFGNTILASPMAEFVRCILGGKVEGIEEALTFINNNARVVLPTIDPNLLTLSNASVAEVTTPIADAAVGSGQGSDQQGVVDKLVQKYINTLEQERQMFFIFIGLWGVVVLLGIAILVWTNCCQDAFLRWRGRKGEHKRGHNGVVWDRSSSEKNPYESEGKGYTGLMDSAGDVGLSAHPERSKDDMPTAQEQSSGLFSSLDDRWVHAEGGWVRRIFGKGAEAPPEFSSPVITSSERRSQISFSSPIPTIVTPATATEPLQPRRRPIPSPALPIFPHSGGSHGARQDNLVVDRAATVTTVAGRPPSDLLSPPFNSYGAGSRPRPPPPPPRGVMAPSPRQLTPVSPSQLRNPSIAWRHPRRSIDPFAAPLDADDLSAAVHGSVS